MNSNPGTKLAPQHGLFVTNLGHSTSEHSSGSSDPSTKAVEGLYKQVESLAQTNLQLTMQSSELLGRMNCMRVHESELHHDVEQLKQEIKDCDSQLLEHANMIKETDESVKSLRLHCADLENEVAVIRSSLRKLETEDAMAFSELDIWQASTRALGDAQVAADEYYRTSVPNILDSINNISHAVMNLNELKVENDLDFGAELNSLESKYLKAGVKKDMVLTDLRELYNSETKSINLEDWNQAYINLRSRLNEFLVDPDINKYASTLNSIAVNMVRNGTSSELKNNSTRHDYHMNKSSRVSSNGTPPLPGSIQQDKSRTSSLGSLPGIKRTTSVRRKTAQRILS